MDTRARTLAVVAMALLAASFPRSVAAAADSSAVVVIHSHGTARLAGVDPSRPIALEVEYWSAAPRFRIRCRADRALPQSVDFDLAFDGVRYQVMERRDEETRLFTATSTLGQTGVVLESEGGDARYRLSLSPGRDRLPVRVERLAGRARIAAIDLLYSETTSAAGKVLMPQALALDLAAGDGPALTAHGSLAMHAPGAESAGGDTFSLLAQRR